MSTDNGGVGKLLAVAVLLMVAVGGLVAMRFNAFGLRNLLSGTNAPASGNAAGFRCGMGNDPAGNARGEEVVPPFNLNEVPKTQDSWLEPRSTPLPPKLTLRRKVGPYTTELEVVLVPGGWFVMGEDDGVKSNQPKRWVYTRDFYIARTEMTNEQYYAFILDNGYSRSQFWTQAGYEYVKNHDMAGTELLGWAPVDENRRVWALSAPAGDVTIELRNEGGSMGRSGAPVLMLPKDGNWSQVYQYDPITRQSRIKYGGAWHDADGEDMVKGPAADALKARGCLFETDFEGRVRLDALDRNTRYLLVTWPDGNKQPSTSGYVSSSEALRLRAAKMPVVSMSWFEADACARWWGGQLPLECWWEKAARGTDARRFPWGNDLEVYEPAGPGSRKRTDRANFNRGQVEEVGSFPKGDSPFGVQDMAGNVTEWVADSYLAEMLADPRYRNPDPTYAGGPGYARTERGSNTLDDDPQVAAVYNRRRADPYTRVNRERGFRLAFTPDAALKAAEK